jgi:hypothetical protein
MTFVMARAADPRPSRQPFPLALPFREKQAPPGLPRRYVPRNDNVYIAGIESTVMEVATTPEDERGGGTRASGSPCGRGRPRTMVLSRQSALNHILDKLPARISKRQNTLCPSRITFATPRGTATRSARRILHYVRRLDAQQDLRFTTFRTFSFSATGS